MCDFPHPGRLWSHRVPGPVHLEWAWECALLKALGKAEVAPLGTTLETHANEVNWNKEQASLSRDAWCLS